MPSFIHNWNLETTNQLIMEQLNWNQEAEEIHTRNNVDMLNMEQHAAFDKIWHSIKQNKGQLFFINGLGGTGKMFLERTICHAVQAQGWIIICIASTGLSALLLPGGRTAHSMFKILIKTLEEHSTCHIPKESQ